MTRDDDFRATSRRQILTTGGMTAVSLTAGCSGYFGDGRTGSIGIEAPPVSLQDEPISLQINGAEPETSVTLEAEMADGNDSIWRSKATFEADSRGRVDSKEAAPSEGTYDRIDPMGWLWSMEPTSENVEFFAFDSAAHTDVTLRATASGSTVIETITRRTQAEGVTGWKVESDDLTGWLYEPPGEGPHPGVLALHGSGGFLLRRRARLLASHGFATFALEYFGDSSATPSRLAYVPLPYFDRAATWLQDREAVSDGPVGVVGTSRGGELALVLGAHFEWVGAVISWVGSGVVWQGGVYRDIPAWILEDRPIPYLEFQGTAQRTDDGYLHFRPIVEQTLESISEEELREATIPVERIDGPVLLISSRGDKVWPSERLSEFAIQRLAENGFEHDYEQLVYETAGHYITAPYQPTTRRRKGAGLLLGGTPAGYAEADAASWPRVLEYLEKGLNQP